MIGKVQFPKVAIRKAAMVGKNSRPRAANILTRSGPYMYDGYCHNRYGYGIVQQSVSDGKIPVLASLEPKGYVTISGLGPPTTTRRPWHMSRPT